MNQSEDKEYQEYLKNQRDIKEYYEGLEIERVTQDLLDAKDKRDALIENIGEFNPEALLADGLEDALIGYSTKGHAIYSISKIIRVFMDRDDMSREDACDFFHFNVDGAYVGEYTPIYMYEE
jgi:hypothetical protein